MGGSANLTQFRARKPKLALAPLWFAILLQLVALGGAYVGSPVAMVVAGICSAFALCCRAQVVVTQEW